LKQKLFNYAYEAKLQNLRTSGEETHSVWDRIVFGKLKEILGGRVRLMVSGSAPLAPVVQDFLRICFCCKVVQGYGLTETTAALTASDANDFYSGTWGLQL